MALSKETVNFTRCSYVAVEIFSEILRRILAKDIPPHNIEVRASGLRNLTAEERLLLRDASSQGYSHFDVTFLYKIIRNINLPSVTAPSNGWGKLPSTSSNNTIGDVIERIRHLRNKVYGHAYCKRISDTDFNQNWSEFSDICQRVDFSSPSSGPTFVSLLSNIERDEFCGETHKIIAEHIRHEEQIDDLYQRVADVTVTIAEIRNTKTSQQQEITPEGQKRLQKKMMKNFLNATHYIPVIPLGKTTLPLSQVFSSVVVVEIIESKEIPRKRKQPERKLIEKTAEIFLNDEGEPVKRIYMTGEAGRGKTVYGLKLLEEWCKVKQGKQSDMQDVLSQFEFLFHVSMRHVEPDRIKVVDMICDSLSEEDSSLEDLITSVLCNSDIRCLVFLDGLDEWSTKSDYFPKTTGIVNYVLFTTSRPWKLEKLQLDYTPQDKVVEILGINPEYDETLIPRIVTHLYGEDDQGLTNRLISYCKQRVNVFKTKELMKLPMILTASCYVWCEEKTKEIETGNEKNADISLTYFSLVIIDMLIQRAEKNNKEVKDYLKEYCNEQIEPKSTSNTMTSLLSQYFPKIIDFLDILTPFCKVAYNDLMSKDTRLVFRRDQLEREMGRQTVELALKVGIISQCWAPGRGMNIQSVSVSFFHKLIQELMAAMHIVFNPDLLQTFSHQCDTIDKIRGLSNIIMYLTGLDSELGCQLSQHAGRIAQTDESILLWRETMETAFDDKAWFLFKLQYEWYNEMVYVRTLIGITDQPKYHVYDVNIFGYRHSKVEVEVAVISEMLRNTNNIVVSVCLHSVPDTCISNIIMYLPQHSESLTALCIVDRNSQIREHLVSVLSQLKQLKCIRFEGNRNDDDVVKALTGLTKLEYVVLHDISVDYTTMSVSNLTHLQYLRLNFVDMTASGWRELLSSLCSIPHIVHVILRYTNINDDNIEYVKSSPLFNFIKHKEGCKNDKTLRLEFYSTTSHQSL